MMPTLSSLVAPGIVLTTTSSATGDDKVGIMTTLGVQYYRLMTRKPTYVSSATKSAPSSLSKRFVFEWFTHLMIYIISPHKTDGRIYDMVYTCIRGLYKSHCVATRGPFY